MSNTTHVKAGKHVVLALVAAMGLGVLLWAPAGAQSTSNRDQTAMTSAQALSLKQLSIAPVGAAMAVGDMLRLNAALNHALDAGLTISEAKEILVQLYAYAGFPRSLNALGELMKVVDTRKQRGVRDAAAAIRRSPSRQARSFSRWARPTRRSFPGHRCEARFSTSPRRRTST